MKKLVNREHESTLCFMMRSAYILADAVFCAASKRIFVGGFEMVLNTRAN